MTSVGGPVSLESARFHVEAEPEESVDLAVMNFPIGLHHQNGIPLRELTAAMMVERMFFLLSIIS